MFIMLIDLFTIIKRALRPGAVSMSVGEAIKRAAELLVQAERAVVFSGAGMSAESGIPTFRDPGGLWDRFDPSLVGTAEGIMSLFAQGGGVSAGSDAVQSALDAAQDYLFPAS